VYVDPQHQNSLRSRHPYPETMMIYKQVHQFQTQPLVNRNHGSKYHPTPTQVNHTAVPVAELRLLPAPEFRLLPAPDLRTAKPSSPYELREPPTRIQQLIIQKRTSSTAQMHRNAAQAAANHGCGTCRHADYSRACITRCAPADRANCIGRPEARAIVALGVFRWWPERCFL
jgi:hypothetical protein